TCRVLWISCLLIGSITCYPRSSSKGKTRLGDSDSGYGFNPSSSNVYSINVGNSDFDSGYGNPDASEHSLSSTGAEHAVYVASPGDWYEEADTSAPVGSYDPGYDGSYGYVDNSAAEGAYEGSPDEDGSYGIGGGTGEESLEPVFSDTSDLQPLFSVSSRSSYQRGRTVFSQTRYTPGEFQPPVRPLSKGTVSQAAPAPRKPAKAPVKGGF
uniref:Uncharacterized protein n=1 Tax=Myripristis murdjan TaxID=586833 RepID=A0A667ZBM5_9TELE